MAGFLAGAYISFGGLLAITVSSGMRPEIWGTLPTFFTGAVFALGLILVVIAGSELLTGNMALVPLAAFTRRVSVRRLFENFWWVLIGNLLGSIFVAYFLAVQTGVVTAELPLARLTQIATAKGVEETVLAIFFPIMAFVAMGFDHVVANMFFLPAAIFADMPGITWGDALHNWIFAFLGNLIGAAVLVAGAYWYLYAREPAPAPGDTSRGRDADGARAARERVAAEA